MDNQIPELENWENIEKDATGGNSDTRNASQIGATRKLVQSIVNLRLSVFSSQVNINKRLDKLNQNIEEASQSSARLTRALNKITFWGSIIAAVGVAVAAINVALSHWQLISELWN